MNLAQSIGWTLVHSVWEIGAIAAFFCLACLAMRKTSSNVRYVVSLVALAACLAAPVATFIFLAPPVVNKQPVAVLAPTPAGVFKTSIQGVASKPAESYRAAPVSPSLRQRIDPILPTLVLGWLLGLAFMCVRLAGGLVVVARIKRSASGNVDPSWQELVDSVAQRLGVRRQVALMATDKVGTPAVIGFFKAVILFPASALTKLSPECIDALLAHELAHVRRYDYIVNFAQTVVETVLFFHPAVWWISSVVRAEREHCCDDIALSALGNREQYARALVGLEQLRRSAPRLAMAANGGPLITRIRRIIMPTQRRTIPVTTWATLILAVAISVGLAGTLHAKQTPFIIKRPSLGATVEHQGRVIDAQDQPVANATVLLEKMNRDSEESGPMQELMSDSSGRFHFQVEKNQPMQIAATKKGVGFGQASWKKDGSVVIRVLPVKPLLLRAVDESGAPVAGVTIGPKSFSTASNFSMLSDHSEFFKRFACKTDGDGRGVIENIPAMAQTALEVTDSRYLIRRKDSILKAPRADDETTIVLHPAGTIEGIVTSGGKPMAHTTVFARSKEESLNGFAMTDNDGKFVLKHQPIGQVGLHARLWRDFSRPWFDPELTVSVTPNTVQHVELKVGAGVPISVLVVSPKGRPLPGLSIEVSHTGSHWFPTAGGKTDKNGLFRGSVEPGPYTVVLEQWTSKITRALPVHEGSPNSITIQAPIEEPDKRIVCRLFDADGKPLYANSVYVDCIDFNGKPAELWGVTDYSGRKVFYLPESRVKSAWAYAKAGNQVSDPKVRPVNGVITLKLHRPSKVSSLAHSQDLSVKPVKSVSASATRSHTEALILGNWKSSIPNVQTSFPPKNGKPAYHIVSTVDIAMELKDNHTFSRTFSSKDEPFTRTEKGHWSIKGNFITLLVDHSFLPLICTVDPGGKRLDHIDIKTWQEMRKTDNSLNGIELRNFTRI